MTPEECKEYEFQLNEQIMVIGEKDAEIDRLKDELKKLHWIVGEDETIAKAKAGLVIQDFICGRLKLCLVCGGKEPCHLKDDPQSPCTFEPTPMELLQLNRKKDADIESLKNELKKIHRIVAEDETMLGKEYLYLSDKYNALLATAAEKDAEIARLKEWQQITIGAGTDHETVVRMAAAEYITIAKQCWEDKYNDLMATAVKFAELTFGYSQYFHKAHREAGDFLESPSVREWRKGRKGVGNGMDKKS